MFIEMLGQESEKAKIFKKVQKKYAEMIGIKGRMTSSEYDKNYEKMKRIQSLYNELSEFKDALPQTWFNNVNATYEDALNRLDRSKHFEKAKRQAKEQKYDVDSKEVIKESLRHAREQAWKEKDTSTFQAHVEAREGKESVNMMAFALPIGAALVGAYFLFK